jgi:hypothetical protein
VYFYIVDSRLGGIRQAIAEARNTVRGQLYKCKTYHAIIIARIFIWQAIVRGRLFLQRAFFHLAAAKIHNKLTLPNIISTPGDALFKKSDIILAGFLLTATIVQVIYAK